MVQTYSSITTPDSKPRQLTRSKFCTTTPAAPNSRTPSPMTMGTPKKVCPARILVGQTFRVGGARGIRTPDLLIANETRYQLRHSPKCGLILAPLPGVLASSVAVSPPTAPDSPELPGRATAPHCVTITHRPRAALRGWHRGRWGGRALPRRPPRERGRKHGPSADGRAPARR